VPSTPKPFAARRAGIILSRLPRRRIGFVSHVPRSSGALHTTTAFAHILYSTQVWLRFAHFASSMRLRATSSNPQSTIRNRQIGFVSHAHSPAGPQPGRRPTLPMCPSSPKFGFVLHNSLCRPPVPGGNWVRFVRFTSPAGRQQERRLPLPMYPNSPKFGFVLQVLPSGGGQIGFVCTFHLFVEPAPDLIGGCPGMKCRSAPGTTDFWADWVCFAGSPSARWRR
jgi:hypothetical protein